jgi:hypothetical protein
VNDNHPINKKSKKTLEQQSMENLRWQETLQALDSVKAGRSVDGQRVHEWLSSWGEQGSSNTPLSDFKMQ